MRAPEEEAPLVPGGPRMERLKRELDAVPGLLGRCRGVRLCGLPALGDVEGTLRLEGLLCLLAAGGVRVTGREAGSAARDEAAIWLGGGGAAALARLRDAAAVLLWPAPDDAAAAAAALGEAAAFARPHWMLCRAAPGLLPAAPPGLRHVVLPEPGHALWGLLDHHPRAEGGGVLDLSGGRGWPPAVLAPPGGGAGKRAARAAFVAALPPARADRFRRRRVLEAARRWVAAHSAVATDRVGPSVFAALLDRPVLPRGAAVAAYWPGCWAAAAFPAPAAREERAAAPLRAAPPAAGRFAAAGPRSP